MDDLKKIAPKLSEIKKENPFVVPPQYFDNFSARLQIRIEAEKVAAMPSRKKQIIYFLKPAFSLVAGLALIFLLVYFPLKNHKNGQLANNTNQNTELTDENYISLIEGIDEELLYAFINEPVINDEYSDEELVSYLSSATSDFEIYMEIDF
ncbi:MAG: hypothetical protein LBV47_09745 [Bacteroidales bacterium]|jgi:hypothetical protein|nr:hypothetical protein [Bacteroidales bacterium]